MPYKFIESRRHKIPKAQLPGDELAGLRCRSGATNIRRTWSLCERVSSTGVGKGRETLIVVGKESLIGPTGRGVQGGKKLQKT
jgi:hypothetical protein